MDNLEHIDAIAYARTLGIDVNEEYSPTQAATLARVGVATIRQAKRAGELSYIALGSRNYSFLGMDVIRWKLSKRRQRTVSVFTTLPKTVGAAGVALGMTNPVNSERSLAYAQKILSKAS